MAEAKRRALIDEVEAEFDQWIRALEMPGDLRQLRDLRRSGIMEVFTSSDAGAPVLSSEKFGNTLDRSNRLFKTYNPVDIEKVKLADEARIKGRRRRNKG